MSSVVWFLCLGDLRLFTQPFLHRSLHSSGGGNGRLPPLAPSTQPNDAMRKDAAMSSGMRSSLWLPVCRLLVASGELEWHWIWRKGRPPTLQEPLDKVYLSAEAVKPDVVGTRLEEMRLNGTRISKETTNRRPTDNPRRKLENNL